MTTSSDVIAEPVPLDSLLKSSTYQGMTDEDIDRIIDYKCEKAARKAAIEASTQAHDELMERLIKEQRVANERAFAQFEASIATSPEYEEVAHGAQA